MVATPLGDVAPPCTRARLESLTGLRFFAAAAVLLEHLHTWADQVPVLRLLVGTGAVGVTFFFVLSGFVLTWSRPDGDPARSFWGRRVARVYPLHVLCWGAILLVDTAVDVPLPGPGPAVAALLLVHAWIPVSSWYFAANPLSWTLSAEAFFYLLFPGLWWVSQRWSVRRLLTVAGATVAVSSLLVLAGRVLLDGPQREAFLYISPAYRVLEFVVGVACGLAYRQGFRLRLPLAAAAAVAAAAFVSLGALGSTTFPYALTRELRDLLFLVPATLLILAAATSDLQGRAGTLSGPVLVRLGEWSFALYISHQVLLRATLTGVGALDGPAANLALCLGFGVLAVAVAGILHVTVERPAERALRARLG